MPGPRPAVDVGSIRITALLDGIGDVDLMNDAFPGAPAGQALAYREQFPRVYGANDTWRLYIRAWLIRAADTLVLVDTGIGTERAPGPAWFGAHGELMSQIEAEGIHPSDINQVVITHLHDDHFGGTVTANGEPAFPAARYLVQVADMDWIRAAVSQDDEARTMWEALAEPLVGAGVVQEIEGTVELAAGVQAHLLPGHTPGHQIVRVNSDGGRVIICGDAFTHPMQLSHPDWANMSDDAPLVAEASRRGLMAELGSDPETVLAPTHFEDPFGRVTTGSDGLAGWEAI